MIKCSHCGCAITPEKQKDYIYYHCTNFHGNCPNKKVWLREEELLTQIKATFQSLKLDKDSLEVLKDELRVAHQSEKQYYEQNLNAIKRQLGQIDARLKIMYNDRLDGRLTTSEYDDLVKGYKEEQQSLLEQYNQHSEADKNFYITANKILDLSQRAWELFENSEPKEKTQLVSFLLQNLSLEGRNLLFEVKTPFNGIVEYAKTKEWLHELKLMRTYA